jgi:hypothetical protein
MIVKLRFMHSHDILFLSHDILFLCFATFRNLSRLFATLVRDFGRDYAKVRSRIGLPRFFVDVLQLGLHRH